MVILDTEVINNRKMYIVQKWTVHTINNTKPTKLHVKRKNNQLNVHSSIFTASLVLIVSSKLFTIRLC